eukprot:g3107.t1
MATKKDESTSASVTTAPQVKRAIDEVHDTVSVEESRLEPLTKYKGVYVEIKAFFKAHVKREPHHGFEHALRVLKNSQTIAESSFDKDILVLALLHDVLDHKFDDVDEKLFESLLEKIYPGKENEQKRNLMNRTIDTISFSKEKKKGMKWYESFLDGNKEWIFRRNVVSDADKLEALGHVGAARCYATQKHFAALAGGPSDAETLLEGVVQHCHDKLFILQTKYMRTPKGVELANTRERELRDVLVAHGVRASDLK